ncbi:ABC transporter permease [Telluribacter sp. SYSU D00476]|uniref:ABC transporter permease n=1 Tax=Telluribacter sp. SYSU D00476 TaxID=2811430 RepID=UPI001FF64B1C|nr:ABC transporter permease [Telluribacter sp. SYSU D00476]
MKATEQGGSSPPRWAQRLLTWLHPDDTLEEVEGDLHELYTYWYRRAGKRQATLRYLLNVLSVLPPFVRRRKRKEDYYQPFFLHPDMLRNYFKIALRNLVNNKMYSFINIFGLATGMGVAILIGLWLYDELSYDSYHQNSDRIALVMQNQTFDDGVRTWDSQAMQLGPELRNTYGSNFKYVVMATGTINPILSVGDKKFIKSGRYMEPEAPEMLTLKILSGTRDGLKDPSSILLSKSVAHAFFGDADPVGKLMKIDNKLTVEVTGVYEDLPQNSSFAELKFIAPWQLLVNSEGYDTKLTWGNSWFQAFVQIADHVDMDKVSSAIKLAKWERVKNLDYEAPYRSELFLHPMKRWHLYEEFKNGVNVGGRIQYVWMYGIIGAFVLLLACINFMNLSTARSEKRAREVGIRKAIGSVRTQLITQFYSESLLVAFFAFVLSLLLVLLALPFFNEVAGKTIEILWVNPWFWVACVGFSFLTGLIAGSYPALYLSSFIPIKVLKGTFRVGRLAAIPRKALVVVQFTVSVTLIIGTIIIFRQIQYSKNRPIGYSRSGLLSIPMKTDEVRQGYDVLRNDLLATGAAVELSKSESQVTNAGITNGGFNWRGKAPGMQDEQVTVGVNHEFGKTIDWKIKEGRDFSRAFATDSSGFILNEAAVTYMGFKKPLGERIKAFGRTYTVIGVVKNMVMDSPYEPIRPTIFYIDSFDRVFWINVKINPQLSASEALFTIETVFKKHNPTTPFEFKFADEQYDAKFRSEERIGKLASFFAVLAIFISCLGLFGLASFVAEQRTKEIGIRKVLGASVANLWQMLSKDFVVLVVVSLFIATPLAYYFMNGWIQNYTYRTEISWWIFALTAVGALVITLLTVSFQALKAALLDPVRSLRSE